ncbi:MAG: DUF3301 domain-containing protein [Granulosicoccus sp.]|nr:DUF3301 domain-containing protein [Granulosicoccus sp.]
MTGHAFLDLIIVALPAAVVGLWWTGSRARELAIAHAKRVCKQYQVQFLDQTVALSRIRTAHDNTGKPCLKRVYRFEFSNHENYRDSGTVTLYGHQLHHVDFPYLRDEQGNRTFFH